MTDAPESLGRIGDYTLLEALDPAGPGELFRARDLRRGRTVVLRLLPEHYPPQAEARAAFLHRARVLTQFTHPNVTTIFDAGEKSGRLYLVFEFVKGKTLHAEIGGHPLTPRRALELTVQIADAVAEVHAAGYDPAGLSPESILVTEKGHSKIALATLAARAGFANGPEYRLIDRTAPEVAPGQVPDERADVFTLGSLLFEMLTARPLSAQVTAPSTLNPHVPKELDAAALRATAQEPDYRYQSLVTMAAELRSIAAILDVREATADEAAQASPAYTGRVVLGVLVVILLAAAAWWWLG